MNCKHCNAPLEYLDKKEASVMLGVDRKTIYRWIANGKLNEVPVEGFKRLKISRKEIEEYLESK